MDPTWNDARTAAQYERFTRDFPMYADTSSDLVELAEVTNAATIVDLACGTGTTTSAALAVARTDIELVALDGSQAMLDLAKRAITDERIRWVCADAADLASHAHDVDAIVCNSAIWQTNMDGVFAAAAEVLRPGGRFAFNIGRQFMILFTEDELSPQRPSLAQYVQAVATLDHDYAGAMGRGGRPLSEETVRAMLSDAGLEVERYEIRSYESTPAQHRAWLEIPIFANNLLAGMPYEQQLEVIDRAYRHVDPSTVTKTRWACFVARRP